MLLIYPDVMDQEWCDALIAEHDSNPRQRITNEVDRSFDGRVLLLQNMTPSAATIAVRIATEGAKAIGRHFQAELYPETVSIVRWAADQEMALHRDGQAAGTEKRTHSAVIYLNDQQDGGEIYFPEIGTTISPRRALLVAFDKSVLHGVRPVMQPRYTLTLWFSTDPTVSIIASS